MKYIVSRISQFIFATLLFCTINIDAQNNNSLLKEKIDSLLSDYDSDNKPGIAISIVKDGKLLFAKGYGIANLEYNIPITSSTIFHVASVSKHFTAFALLLLEQQGQLSLDDDIRKHIPELTDFGKTITLKHLATHTSGLRDQQFLLGLSGWRDDDITTDEDVLELIMKQKELNFSPGDEFGYSNSGYTLLAQVISRISNLSFNEYMKQNIFLPLKMYNTEFKDDYEKIIPNRAYAYHQGDSIYKKSIMNNACVGASNLCTTVDDMALWALNLKNFTVGSPDILQKMSSPTILNNGDSINAGMGFYQFNYKGLKELGHEGFDFGFRAYFGYFPEQQFSATIITNDGRTIFPYDIYMKIVDLCLNEKLTEPYIENDTYSFKLNKDSTTHEYSKDELKDFAGIYYSDELEVYYKIEAKEDFLEISQTRIGSIIVYPIASNLFQDNGEWLYSKFEFIRDNSNNITELHYSGTSAIKNLKFKKIK